MSWFIEALKKYAVFSGRSRRKEYWFFYLFYVIFFLVIYMLLIALIMITRTPWVAYLLNIYTLGMLIPHLSVAVRRLHDTGHSGWWYFIALVPIIGGIWFLVLVCTDSDPGGNKYGPSPKMELLKTIPEN